jgi:hypothetical protein
VDGSLVPVRVGLLRSPLVLSPPLLPPPLVPPVEPPVEPVLPDDPPELPEPPLVPPVSPSSAGGSCGAGGGAGGGVEGGFFALPPKTQASAVPGAGVRFPAPRVLYVQLAAPASAWK